jgi:hypothetical protein
MANTAISLSAKDFLDASGVVIQSADNLADAIMIHLKQSDRINISMAGMPPVSSSYFNVILRRVFDVYGATGLDRVNMDTPSQILRDVFNRSLAAVRRLAG